MFKYKSHPEIRNQRTLTLKEKRIFIKKNTQNIL